MSTTTIKLQFNDDIRRVSIEKDKLTYQDLLSKITSIYKTIPHGDLSRITVRYLDNESDLCTITSNEELQEAFCSFSTQNQLLKLVISLQERKNENPGRENWKEHVKGQCQFRKLHRDDWKEHAKVQCQIRKIHPDDWKEHAKVQCQFRKLHRDAFALMEECKYQAARDVFLEQVKEAKSEWQQRIPYYNLACCEALLGNSAPALEYLEKAVNFGFRNLCKIREDPDLNSLRSLEKFQQLVSTIAERKESKCDERAELRKKICQEWKNRENNFENGRKCHWKKFARNNSSSEAISNEEKSEVKHAEIVADNNEPNVILEKPAEVVVTIEKPVEKPSPVHHQHEKTLAMFEEMGFLNREQNIVALNQVNGDAKLAISVILGL